MTLPQNRRIVITGMGVVAPNGVGLSAFREALRGSVSGIRFQPELQRLGFGCQVGGVPLGTDLLIARHFGEADRAAMNDVLTYASLAALEAFADAGLEIPPADADWVHEDTGAVVGTGIGGAETFAQKLVPLVDAGKVRRLGSAMVEQVMASAPSARIGGLLGLGNQVTTNSSACSTGTEAIIFGFERIRAGLADRMVVGGAEGTSPYAWAGFDAMRVLCRTHNDSPAAASRPMSASAGGFIPAGGAALLVIESLDTARARGAHIHAEILGTAVNCGGHRRGGSMTAPGAVAVRRCIRSALVASNVSPDAVDYINGHLTATYADPLEFGNWEAALERPASRFPFINATKSMIGHALGAAGAIECVATVLQLAGGFVHGSLNCEDLHPDIRPYEARVVKETSAADICIAAKASFGFGDVNSCIIFQKWKDPT